jgi:hypothetical protein
MVGIRAKLLAQLEAGGLGDMAKMAWRLPAGSARAVIAAAGLVVIALIIATYGNAQARSERDHEDDQSYNPLTQPGWDAAHRATDSQLHTIADTK